MPAYVALSMIISYGIYSPVKTVALLSAVNLIILLPGAVHGTAGTICMARHSSGRMIITIILPIITPIGGTAGVITRQCVTRQRILPSFLSIIPVKRNGVW